MVNDREGAGMSSQSSIKSKTIIAGIVLVAIAAIVIAVVVLSPKAEFTEERRTGSAIMAEEVIESFKISALTYRYTNVIFEEDVNKLGDLEIPFTTTYFAVQYDGIMEIGIDGSLIEIEQNEDTITVKLPPVQVLSHTLVNDSVNVLFDVGTVFNQNDISEYIELFNSEQISMEAKAGESGLFDQARISIQEQLRSFLNSFPDIEEQYTIVFE
jgi:hypothetical protein